jgi:hypothetical protein
LEQENPALKVITPRQQGVDKRLKKLASSSNAVNVFSRRSSYHRSKKKKKKKKKSGSSLLIFYKKQTMAPL